MVDIYNNQTYLTNHPSWHSEDSAWKAGKIQEALRKHVVGVKTVAEIGCGSGEIISELSKAFPDVSFFGFDISKDAYAIAKEKTDKHVNFECVDLLETSKKFDVLLVIDVFEHVENYIDFVRKCRGHAKYFVFHIPLDMSVQKLLRPQSILSNRYQSGHLHYFSRETALATLRDAGYTIVSEEYTRWGLEMKQNNILKKIGKLPLFILDAISTDYAAKILGGNSLLVVAK